MERVYAGPPLARSLALCADTVAAVMAGRSLTDVLSGVRPEHRPAVQALSFHVLRWWGSAVQARRVLAPKQPPPRVDALLCVALALLWPDSDPPYPDHTLVDQAVGAVRHRSPAAAGFVNAVLRHFLRERTAVAAAAMQTPEGAWNHPAWWVQRLREDWPTEWQPILRASQAHPPMCLRVNRRRVTVDRYLDMLAEHGKVAWPALPDSATPELIVLERPCPVSDLPGFDAGDVSVQDSSAQRAAHLLHGTGVLRPGARVLDACSAPGGKMAHLLEGHEIDLLALDHDAARLSRVTQTLHRLGLSARTAVGDAGAPGTWWDGQPFDAIVLDAPCSASGIVRRHPDIRWLRRPEDITALAKTQSRMLDALWPLLAPGGVMLYATCSVFRAEGQDRVDAFLQRQPAGTARLGPASPGHLLPLPDNASVLGPARLPVTADGFYYALLHKP